MKRGHDYLAISALVLGLLWGCGSGEVGNDPTIIVNSGGNSSGSGCISNATGSPSIKEFCIPVDENGRVTAPYGLAMDNQKQVWFAADIVDSEFPPDKIGIFDSINGTFPSPLIIPGALNSTSQGQLPPNTVSSQPRELVFDPVTRDFWFTESGTSVIGRVRSRNIFEYPIPTQDSQPLGITIDSSGKIWFTESLSGKIGRLDPSAAIAGTTAGFTEYLVGGGPTGIAVDSQQNIWFTDPGANQLGELDVSSGVGITKYFSIPTKASNPTGIAIDKGDRVWFTEMDTNKIGRFDPTTNQFAEFLLPNGGSPSGIAIDTDTGIVWFTEFRGNRIGRLDPAVATPNTVNGIMEFQIPTLNSGPTSIVIDTDKIVWFSETSSKKIGKLIPPP